MAIDEDTEICAGWRENPIKIPLVSKIMEFCLLGDEIMKLSDFDKPPGKCDICDRESDQVNGNWCPCCFSLWYDGGPAFQDRATIRRVSLMNDVNTFAPMYSPLEEQVDPIRWDEAELSNQWGE